MKNLCLENYGVFNLETREMQNINGGILPILGGIAAIMTIAYFAGYGARLAYDSLFSD